MTTSEKIGDVINTRTFLRKKHGLDNIKRGTEEYKKAENNYIADLQEISFLRKFVMVLLQMIPIIIFLAMIFYCLNTKFDSPATRFISNLCVIVSIMFCFPLIIDLFILLFRIKDFKKSQNNN